MRRVGLLPCAMAAGGCYGVAWKTFPHWYGLIAVAAGSIAVAGFFAGLAFPGLPGESDPPPWLPDWLVDGWERFVHGALLPFLRVYKSWTVWRGALIGWIILGLAGGIAFSGAIVHWDAWSYAFTGLAGASMAALFLAGVVREELEGGRDRAQARLMSVGAWEEQSARMQRERFEMRAEALERMTETAAVVAEEEEPRTDPERLRQAYVDGDTMTREERDAFYRNRYRATAEPQYPQDYPRAMHSPVPGSFDERFGTIDNIRRYPMHFLWGLAGRPQGGDVYWARNLELRQPDCGAWTSELAARSGEYIAKRWTVPGMIEAVKRENSGRVGLPCFECGHYENEHPARYFPLGPDRKPFAADCRAWVAFPTSTGKALPEPGTCGPVTYVCPRCRHRHGREFGRPAPHCERCGILMVGEARQGRLVTYACPRGKCHHRTVRRLHHDAPKCPRHGCHMAVDDNIETGPI